MDQNEQDIMLASHEELLRRLMVLIVKMDTTIDQLKETNILMNSNLEVITRLLQRRTNGEESNGNSTR